MTECGVSCVCIFLAISYTFLDHLSHNCGQSSWNMSTYDTFSSNKSDSFLNLHVPIIGSVHVLHILLQNLVFKGSYMWTYQQWKSFPERNDIEWFHNLFIFSRQISLNSGSLSGNRVLIGLALFTWHGNMEHTNGSPFIFICHSQ